MYVKIIPDKKSGRQLLCYFTSTQVNGKTVNRMHSRIGYFDELRNRYPDPIAYFKAEAKRCTEQEKARQVTLTYSLQEHICFDEQATNATAMRRGRRSKRSSTM